MMQDPNELLARALAQLGRERGAFPDPTADNPFIPKSRDPYDGYLKRDMMDDESAEPYSSDPYEMSEGRRGFSTPKADKQFEIDKYFENIRRLRERGILPTPKAQEDFSAEDVLFAGVPGRIKYGGPANSIIRAPHIDSRFVDGYIQNYRERDLMRGPQLPGFV